jgi:hypothetical protein
LYVGCKCRETAKHWTDIEGLIERGMTSGKNRGTDETYIKKHSCKVVILNAYHGGE